jgi:hypothetical protein
MTLSGSQHALVAVALGIGAALASCRGGPDRAHEHHHEHNLPPVGPTLAVALDGTSVDVRLAALRPEGGPNTVRLLGIFEAAFPSADAASLHFDLVGSDGFRPTSRPRCTRLLTGAEAAKTRLDVVTHDVSFDGDLELPGCYRVRSVVRIEVTSRPVPAAPLP